MFSGILQSQAPAKQDATSTISTLCLRLTSATLVEDRRAAVKGLRSFARDYRESVASGGLRGLITALGKDKEDEETAKFILETLLLLFANSASTGGAEDLHVGVDEARYSGGGLTDRLGRGIRRMTFPSGLPTSLHRFVPSRALNTLMLTPPDPRQHLGTDRSTRQP